MKSKIKSAKNNRAYALIIVGLFAVVGVVLLVLTKAQTPPSGSNVSAGAAAFSLSPSSGTYAVNTSTTIELYEDSGAQEVNAVSVKMSYNASLLDIVSIDSNGTSFAGCPTKSGASGTIALVCYVNPPTTITGKKLIAKITIKAKASSGAATISFVNESASNSKIALAGSGDNIWNQVTSGGSYTLSGGTSNPGTGGGTGTGTGTSSGGTSGTSAPKTTPSTTTPKTTSGTAGGTKPTPSSQSVAQAPATSSEPVQVQEQATGFLVAIKLVDASGKAVVGAKVSLDGKTAVSDATGVATFSGVAAGKHKLRTESVLGVATQDIDVNQQVASTDVQQFSVTVKKSSSKLKYLVYVAVLAALAGATFVIVRKFRSPWKGGPSAPSGPSATVSPTTPTPPEQPTAIQTGALPETVVSPVGAPAKPIPTPTSTTPAPTQPDIVGGGAAPQVINPSDKPQ